MSLVSGVTLVFVKKEYCRVNFGSGPMSVLGALEGKWWCMVVGGLTQCRLWNPPLL